MPLTRKLRRIGGSLLVATPKDLADLYDAREGDQADIEPLGDRTFRIRLVRARSESRER